MAHFRQMLNVAPPILSRGVRRGVRDMLRDSIMQRLNERFMATLTVQQGKKDRLIFDTECPGLGVRVTAKGTRSFLVPAYPFSRPKSTGGVGPMGCSYGGTGTGSRSGSSRGHGAWNRHCGRAAPKAGCCSGCQGRGLHLTRSLD